VALSSFEGSAKAICENELAAQAQAQASLLEVRLLPPFGSLGMDAIQVAKVSRTNTEPERL
jgi:hypothetical protein